MARLAGGFYTASLVGSAGPAELLAALPGAALGGYALLFMPRERAGDLSALASALEARLGAGVPVLAALTAGDRISLGVAAGTQGAKAFALGLQSLQQDLDSMVSSAPSAAAILVLADPAAPAASVRQVLAELGRRLPDAATAGAIVAPPAAKGSVSLGGMGGRGAGGFMALVLPAPAGAALDVCGYAPFGPELEVFEAALPRQGPNVLLKIGTDEEGSMDDAEETEKGTAGIARRVSVPAAAAVRDAMKEAGVSAPREVWIGVPGVPKSERTPRAQADGKTWALFPWAGLTKAGGVVLGGRGPVAEGLCPKASLDFARCFRIGSPGAGGAGARLAAEARGGGGALAIASAGVPPGALQELAKGTGEGTLSLVAAAVLGSRGGGAANDVFSQALALVKLGA